MVIKSRKELKDLFRGHAIPLSADFDSLLDSALLKADDQFFGKWRAGFAYKPNDVVLYDNKLYTFVGKTATNSTDDCNCGGGNEPPGTKGCWTELRIDVNDHDWEIVRDDDKVALYMYAKEYGKIGIGTKAAEMPEAFLHLNDDKTGSGSQFLFNPTSESTAEPMFKMKKAKLTAAGETRLVEDNADFVAQNLDGVQVNNETNTNGFLFKRRNKAAETAENPPLTEGTLLMVTADENQANIGIGTDKPLAMVDMLNADKRQILLNPNFKQEAEMVIGNLTESGDAQYLAHSVGKRFTLLTTNALKGFMFRKGVEYQDFINQKNNDDTGTSVMVVDTQTGNIGIGTESPTMRLQIEGRAGKVQVNLDGLNPSINIIDPRPRRKAGDPPTYLAVGAADDVSVLATNAKKGFVFKRGTDITTVNDKIQLGDSYGILKLYPQDFENSQYNALLDGYAIAKGFYARPAPFKVSTKWPLLTDSLSKLSALSPISFEYDGRPDEKHYGFDIEDMVNNVVDATLQLPDDTKVIAYQNLVAMLVGAVKELNTNVSNLTKRVNDLEKKAKK